jgi:hypothetical protein
MKKLLVNNTERDEILKMHNSLKEQAQQPTQEDQDSIKLNKALQSCIKKYTWFIPDKTNPIRTTKSGKRIIYGKGPNGNSYYFYADMTALNANTGVKKNWVCDELANPKPKTETPKTDNAQTATGTLNQEQQQFIEKWTGDTQGYIYNPSRIDQIGKVSVDVLNLGAPAGLFPKGTVLWYDPNKQKDISRTDDSVLDDILDNQSINRRACKKNIEDFYKAFQTRKSVVIDPAKLDQSKRIVQACKDQHYGNWGILGGGKNWDNILDILSGKVSGGTPSSSPYRLQ